MHTAFWRAAKGKRQQPDVVRFVKALDRNLNSLGEEIRHGVYQPGPFNTFKIYDPKEREIYAPCFRDRVVHHALINHIGSILERVAVYDSYACRSGKGTLKAVQRVQYFACRFPCYVQIDIQRFFDSIQQKKLFELMVRRFKNEEFLYFIHSLITAYHKIPGLGLPIGALTSQYFANHYLDVVDRFLLEKCKVGGMVRYMDDLVWFVENKKEGQESLKSVIEFLAMHRGLNVTVSPGLQKSYTGIRFCGYRILPHTIRLGKRKKKRYLKAWRNLEKAYTLGLLSDGQLQRGYDSVKAIMDPIFWTVN